MTARNSLDALPLDLPDVERRAAMPLGFRAAAAAIGIKASGRPDLALVATPEETGYEPLLGAVTVAPYAYPLRYGGDEFVILMPETGVEQAHALAERLRLWLLPASVSLRTGVLRAPGAGTPAAHRRNAPALSGRRRPRALARGLRRGRGDGHYAFPAAAGSL